MPLLVWIILFSIVGGLLSAMAAAVFLLFPDRHRERILPHFVSFAIGALLGAAFLALIPHAIQQGAIEFHQLGLTLLVGLLGFFLMEKLVLWRHCHEHSCEAHSPPVTGHSHHHIAPTDLQRQNAAGTLILIGDGIHNLVDGVLIAAAFLTDIHLGIITSLAVAAHEIPQEVGDFAVLLHSGFSKSKAFLYNIISSLSTVVGALVAYWSFQDALHVIPYVLAIAASSFIYIAVADLIPGLHKRIEFRETVRQIVLISLGVITIYLAHATLH